MSALTAETAFTIQRRASRYAERAHFELVEALIEEWADLQTERLMREILARPVAFYRRDIVAVE